MKDEIDKTIYERARILSRWNNYSEQLMEEAPKELEEKTIKCKLGEMTEDEIEMGTNRKGKKYILLNDPVKIPLDQVLKNIS